MVPARTSAVRRGLTWVLCVIAMALGSLAWSAWAFLNTWADPTATERVTEAVLADRDARDEVLGPMRSHVRAAVPAEAGLTDAQIDDSLDDVLSDPNVRARIADAFVGSNGLLRADAAGEAFGGELARRQPGLAPYLDGATPELSLPDLSTTDRARDLARTSVWWLALGSAALFGLSFAVGDRRRTARRCGVWAASLGLMWLIGPPIAAWLARRLVTNLDATVDVVVHEYARPIVSVALILTTLGVAAVVASFVPAPRRPAPIAAGRIPARPVRAHREAFAPAGRVQRRSDTQELPAQFRPADQAGWGTEPTVVMTSTAAETPPTIVPADDDDTGEIDVWAAYGTP